MKIKSKT